MFTSIAAQGREDELVQAEASSRLTFFCDRCGQATAHLCIADATAYIGVARSTVYSWMKRGLVHWRVLPGGHRLLCQGSLTHSMEASLADLKYS